MRLGLHSNSFLTFWGVCTCMHLVALWKCGYDSRVKKAEKEPKAIWESNSTLGGADILPTG